MCGAGGQSLVQGVAAQVTFTGGAGKPMIPQEAPGELLELKRSPWHGSPPSRTDPRELPWPAGEDSGTRVPQHLSHS